mgnify:CR=1 FL=1
MKKYIIIIVIFQLLSFSITVGSEVKEKKYKKIASLYMASDEVLFDLVDKKRVIAWSGNYDGNEMSSILGEKIKNDVKIEDNIEFLLNLEPDLVIASERVRKEIVLFLEEAGIELYRYKIPRSFEQQKEMITNLAILLEEEERGKEIIENMEKRLKLLQEKIKKNNNLFPRVLEYSHYEVTNGQGSIFNDMLENLYITNLAVELGVGKFGKISKEKVIEINPDIILIPVWRKEEDSDNMKFIDILKNDESFNEVNAIKNNKIYTIPGKYLYISSQYIVEGMEEIANKVYGFKKEEY